MCFFSLTDSVASKNKKPCVQYLPAEKSCDSPASSHGSMLDSPATPSTALASPAAPAATHSEQAQPLSLTTKPEARAQLSLHSASFLSNKAAASSSSLTSQSSLLSRPRPFTSMPPTALLTTPPSFAAIPSPQAALAVLQAQPLSLVTKPAEWGKLPFLPPCWDYKADKPFIGQYLTLSELFHKVTLEEEGASTLGVDFSSLSKDHGLFFKKNKQKMSTKRKKKELQYPEQHRKQTKASLVFCSCQCLWARGFVQMGSSLNGVCMFCYIANFCYSRSPHQAVFDLCASSCQPYFSSILL